ncbi:GNAT family N-acetyltransferase [Endothiovibrio diazotrophicus]
MIAARPVGLEPLVGSRLVLERSAPEHAAFMRECYRDEAFMDLYRLAQRRTESEAEIAVRLEAESATLPQQRRFIEWVIQRTRADGSLEPIGLGSLADFQHKHRRAEFLIGMLDRGDRRTGAALEATLLILDFAFNRAGLNKVMSLVYAFNQDSQDNTLQLGFVQEGHLREHIYSDQYGFIDLYQNGMIEKEFRTNQRLARLSRRMLRRDITQRPEVPTVMSREERTAATAALIDALAKRPQS